MTSRQVVRDLAVGIRAVYQLLPESGIADYPMTTVARQIAAINAAWEACFAIAIDDPRARDAAAVPEGVSLPHEASEEPESVNEPGHEATDVLDLRNTPVLIVKRLHIGSPFDMEFLIQGGAAGSAIITGLYLLYRVMRNPKQLGGWLPGVLEGWQVGMHEVDAAKRLRKRYELGAQLATAAEQLAELELVEIEIRGVEDSAPDFKGADAGADHKPGLWSCPDQGCAPTEIPPAEVTYTDEEFTSDLDELLNLDGVIRLFHIPSFELDQLQARGDGPPKLIQQEERLYIKSDALGWAQQMFDVVRCSGTCRGIYPRDHFVYIEG